MRRIGLLMFSLFTFLIHFGQSLVNDKTNLIGIPFQSWFLEQSGSRYFLSPTISFNSIGVAWESNLELDAHHFEIAYKLKTTKGWTDWKYVHGETNPKETPTNKYWSHLVLSDYLEECTELVLYFITGSQHVYNVQVDVSDLSKLSNKNLLEYVKVSSGTCPSSKSIIPRSEWWGGLPEEEMHYPNANNSKTVSYNTNTTHAFIHHGASTNNYTDGAAVVRGYWSYHVNSKGWKDIGYNYVLDKFGNLYLGRHNPDWPNQDCLGAHTGSSNPYSFAVCFAGDYSSTSPSQNALDSLSKLLAWKCDLRGMDPEGEGLILGETKHIISGHRDAPDASTTCPGDMLYQSLGNVRSVTQSILDGCIVPDTPTDFAVIPTETSKALLKIGEDNLVESYVVYLSSDGVNFNTSFSFVGNTYLLDGLSLNNATYIKLKAVNGAGESYFSEVLGCLPIGELNEMIVVNGFDRGSNGNSKDFVVEHGEALLANEQGFGSSTNEGVLSELLVLNDFQQVDYILGEESTVDETFSDAEQLIIQSYLNQGGKLFVSGSEIGWDLSFQGSNSDQDFYNQYLKASYLYDAPENESSTYYTIQSNSISVFGNLNLDFDDGTNGTYNVDWPDAIDTLNGSLPGFYFENFESQYAGIYYHGLFPAGSFPGKLIYLTVPFETILGEQERNMLMDSILTYFEDPFYEAPMVNGKTMYCEGDSLEVLNAIAANGGDVLWYVDEDLEQLLFEGDDYPINDTVLLLYAIEQVGFYKSEITQVSITIQNNPIAYAGNDTTVCMGDTVQLIGNGGGSYAWSNDVTTANQSIVASRDTLLVLTVNLNGCLDQDSIYIQTEMSPIVSFYTEDTLLTLGNAVANFNNNSTNASWYEWHFGDGTSSVDVAPWHEYETADTFTVTLIAGNDWCLADTITLEDYIYVEITTGVGMKTKLDVYFNEEKIQSIDLMNPIEEVRLLDVQGREVPISWREGNEQIHLLSGEMSSGLYYLMISNSKMVKSFPIFFQPTISK